MGHNLEFNAGALGKKIEAQIKLAQLAFPEITSPNERMSYWTDDTDHGYAAIFHQMLLEEDSDTTAYLEDPNDSALGKRLAAKIKDKVIKHAH